MDDEITITLEDSGVWRVDCHRCDWSRRDQTRSRVEAHALNHVTRADGHDELIPAARLSSGLPST